MVSMTGSGWGLKTDRGAGGADGGAGADNSGPVLTEVSGAGFAGGNEATARNGESETRATGMAGAAGLAGGKNGDGVDI